MVVCGGPLGIFVATLLLVKEPNIKVAVTEEGSLKDRYQEWNISMKEISELVKLEILTLEEVDIAIKKDFPEYSYKNRESFNREVINLRGAPSVFIEKASTRFTKLGGTIFENQPLRGIVISDLNGVALDVGKDEKLLTSRMIIDCMGNASPISKQQQCQLKPNGVCAVVG